MIRKGTGSANSHPTTRMGLRPMRSDARAATRLMIALVTPKLTMKDVMAVFELRPNSCSPRSGSTVRSRPTMAPTKELRTTSSANCGRFSRSPSRISRSEEHTSELQSPDHLVCRLLLEKKKKKIKQQNTTYKEKKL